jgi:hypothetical protein
VHLCGLTHVLHPEYPLPLHCAQRGEVQPDGSGAATLLVVADAVVVGPGLTVLVGVGWGEPPPVMPNHSMSRSPLTGMLWVTPVP